MMTDTIFSEDEATCAYCGGEYPTDTTDHALVPAVGDDAEWERISQWHAGDCEWITTRAHRDYPVAQ